MAPPTPVTLRAAAFADAIGVNTHINWQATASAYKDQAKVRAALDYLGVNYVRDATPFAGWTQPFYETLAADGIKFNIPVSSTEYNRTGSFQADLARIDAFARAKPGSVASIEGLNEVNTWPVNYGGGDTATNLSLGREVQAQLYREADGFASLKDVPILNLTVGGIPVQQASVMGDMSAISDYGTWHVYFSNGDQPGANIASGVAAAKLLNPFDPVQITETNYYTAVDAMEWGGGGVTEAVQAKFGLNLLMDAAKAGVARTYFYELLDNGLTPTTTIEGSLGLFHGDGTPKAAATAIHNLTAILADEAGDASSFATGALDFSVSGLPGTGKTLLLQKADGRYDLVVWAEPDIWDQPTRSAIAAPATPVTVTLGQPAGTISVYDPLTGTAPIAGAKNTNTITVTVTDHPLILELAGSGTAAPVAPPVGPATASVGSGPDALVLRISQDAYQGSAQYTVAVDGKQIGGTLTASAPHGGGGEPDTVVVKGDWGLGNHTVTLTFLNDAYGGSPATDRNLYLDAATYNGAAVAGAARAIYNGSQSFAVKDASSPALTIGSGTDSIALKVSQDAYKGDAQYAVLVDGTQVGGVQTARGLHGLNQYDPVTVKGSWAAGDHKVTVKFLNDAWGGTPDTDRNLYVEGVTYDGKAVAGGTAALMGAGGVDFVVTDTTAPSVNWIV